MNISSAVSSLIMQLGLYGIGLPYKDDISGKPIPTETVVKDVLTKTTIPMYSQFVPWNRSVDADLRTLKCVDEKHNIYQLPEFLTLTPIMHIISVRMPTNDHRGVFGTNAYAYGINQSAQGVATSIAYMMLTSQMRSEPTFEYLGFNKIRLFGYPKVTLTFTAACEHLPSGESIEDSCYDSFMELATLDMKIFLYHSLKLYNEIPSAHGTSINLKIDEYQSAEADRSTLLDRWRDTFHLDQDWWEWM